jgi:hypothetical protein
MRYDKYVCFFVISCKKNKNLHRNFRKPNQYIIIANPLQEEKYILNGNQLSVKASDTYLGLPEKIIMAFEAFVTLKEFNRYTHVFKIDDDCKIINNVGTELYQFLSSNPYSGGHLNYKMHPDGGNRDWHLNTKYDTKHEYWGRKRYDGFYVPWLRGSNYVLAKTLVKKINQIWNYNNLTLLRKTEPYEDLMIGKVCFFLGVSPKMYPRHIKIVLDEFDLAENNNLNA